VSLRHVAAQLINDKTHTTLAATSTIGAKGLDKKTMTEKAVWVGEQIAAAATEAKISSAVFDRGAKQYHGRVAALADAARAKGLEI